MSSRIARQDRVFLIRLELGVIIHECLERFAAEHGITHAALTLHGAASGFEPLIP